MKEPQTLVDYRRIAKALDYINHYSPNQPTLDEVARNIGMSPYHFQKTFSRWSGLSPKRFLQAVTIEHARTVLLDSRPTIDAAAESGLSGTGRLHDLFITLDAVPPGAYKAGGESLVIRWGVAPTPFGQCFVAVTEHGICRIEFTEDGTTDAGLDALRADWPNARYARTNVEPRRIADTVFIERRGELRIAPRGTNFQVQVWRSLLSIPEGMLTTYGDVASRIGRPAAARAVGNAAGCNPIAYLIPCHRVIRRIGDLGGYRWGVTRKRAMLIRETG